MSNNPTLDVLTEIHQYNLALRATVSVQLLFHIFSMHDVWPVSQRQFYFGFSALTICAASSKMKLFVECYQTLIYN